MNLIGNILVGATTVDLDVDAKRVDRFAFPACRVIKLSAYLDGLGAGEGSSQVLRGVIYDDAGVLVAVGDEVTIADMQTAGWVDLLFNAYPGGVTLLEDDYDLGVIAGASEQIARLYGDTATNASKVGTDTYSDGPSDPIGSVSNASFAPSIFATYVLTMAVPDMTEIEYARMPFSRTQSFFGLTSGSPISAVGAVCGWYGTRLDAERASVVVVAEGGALADLVGERLRITSLDSGRSRRQVIAYCHSVASLNDEEALALPRRLYTELAPLSKVPINVAVEVMA